ncbi:phage tail tape measure protein [Muribaculum intestinale]|jgi:TP901 family phage tail tape measure protein|uniref:phage tail tape measure protein n=4 Tax=Muribaculum TaxID=1918540 RepID=UPI00259D25C7|nr:phage tail tape measure protein [Muribaculum intestinale]
MAQSVDFEIRLKAPDGSILRNLRMEVDGLGDLLKGVTRRSEEAGAGLRKMAATSVLIDTSVRAVENLKGVVSGLVAPFASFEQAMAKANTMANKSGEEFKALERQIKSLGNEIPLLRDEIAGGLYQVISNGVPEDNWIDYLKKSTKAAVGGVADLGQTVTVTATLIKNYGMSWDAAGAIQDKIQMTAKNGVTSFEQLAQSLPRVSGSASQLGVEMNELMAVFATSTGVTGNTSEVSTQLAAVLNSLIKPTSEATAAADAMGIKFDAASVKACGGFRNFLVELDASVQAYAASSGQLAETIYGQLFGSAEALRLLGSLTGEQKDKFADNIAAMEGSAGTIDEAYIQMSSTVDASMTVIKNKMASMGDWIASAVSFAAPWLEVGANMGTAIMSMSQLSIMAGKLVTGIKSLELASHAAAAAQHVVSAATKAWSVAQAALNVIMSLNPVGIVVMAIAALVAIVIAAYNNCEEFRNICDKVWAVVKQLASAVWDFLVKAFERASEVIRKAWEWIKNFFGIDSAGDAKEVAEAVNAQADATQRVADANKDVAVTGLKVAESVDWQAMSYNRIGEAIEKQKAKVASLAGVNADAARKEAQLLKAMEARHDKLAKQYGLASSTGSIDKKDKVNYKSGTEGYYKALERELEDKLVKIDAVLDPQSYRTVVGQLAEIKSWLNGLESYRHRVDVELKFPNASTLKSGDVLSDKIDLTKNFKILKPTDIIPKEVSDRVKGLAESLSMDVGDGIAPIRQGLSSMAGMLHSVARMTNESTGAWLQWGSSVIDACSRALPAIMAVTAAKAAESAAETPIVGWIAAGAAIAAVIASFAQLPKFAEGGIAYGPTIGLFGEYSGASNNPEVVAPLNKLKELIAPQEVTAAPAVIRLVVRGRDLEGVLNYNNNLRRRTT